MQIVLKKARQVIMVAVFALVCSPNIDSRDLAAGMKAPDFSSNDIEEKVHRLSDYKGKYVVLEWVNHGCPFVRKHYDSRNMQSLQKEMAEKGVIWLSVCSSAKGKQGYYSAGQWKKVSRDKGMRSTAILPDELGTIGKLYGAKTTPHMFVIAPDGNLIYRGAIDDRPTTDLEDVPGAKNHVRAALDEAMAGRKVSIPQTQSYGCSVKYK
jgi:hypothetical protein